MSPVPPRIGPYRVERELARGGMGIVYLARDTRLDRAVALKALPDDLSSDPERLVRFEREAKLLASLSHPNIAGIYGVEIFEGRSYLALEHVEGGTLADRLARGPLPTADALGICIQIAAGIEAAHECGVIHRDLKPSNVMVTPSDQAKVVDFGLARGKTTEGNAVTPDAPTVTKSPVLAYPPTPGGAATTPGVILGTAPYLSPEQVRGKPVDRRTDIWSFGCVLYECLTGTKAFEGETVSDLVAKILRTDPDWSRLPTNTPPRLRELLQQSLRKDPQRRLRDIGDARLSLEEILEGTSIAPSPHRRSGPRSRRILVPLGLAMFLGAAGVLLWNTMGSGRLRWPVTHGVKRVSIQLPTDVDHAVPGFSPDGRYLVGSVRPRTLEGGVRARWRLYRRAIDKFQWETVEGSIGNGGIRFSPDGKWLYFFRGASDRGTESQLVKIPMGGGAAPVVVVADIDSSWRSACVLSSGDILFTRGDGTEYVRVPADGGPPSRPLRFDADGASVPFWFPFVQPDGERVFVAREYYERNRFLAGFGLLAVKSGKVKMLAREGGWPSYFPTGHLLFSRGSTLLAARFDLRRGEFLSEPVAVLDGLWSVAGNHGAYMLSRDGTLVYPPGGATGRQRRLVAADADGHLTEWGGVGKAFGGAPVVSPDGKSALSTITNAGNIDEIWISNPRESSAQRIAAVEGVDCAFPVWAPNGAQIAYARIGSTEGDGVYVQALEGGPARLLCRSDPAGVRYRPTSWSPDGSMLLLDRTDGPTSDIYQVPASGSTAPIRLVGGPGTQRSATFSPNGRWVAFVSDESGTAGLYVARYYGPTRLGVPVLISASVGDYLRWSRMGSEIYYDGANRQVMSMVLQLEPRVIRAAPVSRWDLRRLNIVQWSSFFDVLPNGQLLMVQQGDDEGEITRLDVVFNFVEEMRHKLDAARKR